MVLGLIDQLQLYLIELLGLLTGLGLISLRLISVILEIMDSLQTDRPLITIDIEKAFDSVNHSS